MTTDQQFMQRCIQLAELGIGHVAPNPLVGAVLVHNNKIVGEGYHHQFGKAHAEVNAINKVDDELLKDCTLYVNLEPCSHFGKTPPCTDLIIEKKIKRVVIGCIDPYKEVSGRGIEKLKSNGVEVIKDICLEECRELNKRFFTSIEKKRPYIILKFAKTADGFIGFDKNIPGSETRSKQISNEYSQRIMHKWRAEESAILVGTNTAIEDNPQLNARLFGERDPIRIAIDKDLKIPSTHYLLDGRQNTIIFNEKESGLLNPLTRLIQLDFNSTTFLRDIFIILSENKIQSVLIEGGSKTLQSFIRHDLWDEARVFTSPKIWGTGIKAPDLGIHATFRGEEKIGADVLSFYNNSYPVCF